MSARLISCVSIGLSCDVRRLTKGLYVARNRRLPRRDEGRMAASDIDECCRERLTCVLRRLDAMPHSMSVYCQCGRIVDLDRQEMELKIILGKILDQLNLVGLVLLLHELDSLCAG